MASLVGNRVTEVARTGGRLHDPTAHPRVAIGAIFTECNHLGGAPIDRSWYERYELLCGEELLAGATGAVAGMLQVLRERHLTPVPLLYASTCAGGPLTRDTYEELKGGILKRLRAALPVDGVLLPLHGAAAAEHVGDPEGDLIGAVRALVGAETPVVATLDLHAHVTAAMVHGADALLAWETYPHRDALSTGERAARLLADTVAGTLPAHHGDGQGAGGDRRDQRLHRRRRPVRRPDAPCQGAWRRMPGCCPPACSWCTPTSTCLTWAAARWWSPTATRSARPSSPPG